MAFPGSDKRLVKRIIEAAASGNLRALKKTARTLDDGSGIAATVASIRDLNGRGAFHVAATEGKIDVCKYFVEELGLDVNVTSYKGDTPLFHAALENHLAVVEYLLDHGADPSIPDERGYSVLHCASQEGHCEVVNLLLSKGIPVDPNSFVGTPLNAAARNRQEKIVKILLEHGANPNKVSDSIFSPLLVSVLTESLECTKLLIKAGADVNASTPSGTTPLSVAAHEGLTDFIKCLLEAGADPNVVNESGRRPIELAALFAKRHDVEILFHATSPIPYMPDWSVDGIISFVKSERFKLRDEELSSNRFAEMKSKGGNAFKKNEYLTAIYYYSMAMEMNPLDATIFSNRSVCWLRRGEGDRALHDAQVCRMLRPKWPKACYREGAARSLLNDYAGAADAFLEGLTLDPGNEEIEKALWEAVESMKKLHCSDKKQ
ncbi:ankyrin-1-like [Ananas comosus]|uniref:Ankyrin-1-like n=1 Tax=Ananas comosus TaxID=4615 RepID=A0A6P5F5K7_ANACO|nr:ankyrin-1-like [Ananas comosus]